MKFRLKLLGIDGMWDKKKEEKRKKKGNLGHMYIGLCLFSFGILKSAGALPDVPFSSP